jgi:hypothetical protein
MELDMEIPLMNLTTPDEIEEYKSVVDCVKAEFLLHLQLVTIELEYIKEPLETHNKQFDAIIEADEFASHEANILINKLLKPTHWRAIESMRQSDTVISVYISSATVERRKSYYFNFMWTESITRKQKLLRFIRYKLYLHQVSDTRDKIMNYLYLMMFVSCPILLIMLLVFMVNHPLPDHSWTVGNCRPMTTFINETCYTGRLFTK